MYVKNGKIIRIILDSVFDKEITLNYQTCYQLGSDHLVYVLQFSQDMIRNNQTKEYQLNKERAYIQFHLGKLRCKNIRTMLGILSLKIEFIENV